MLLKIIWYLTFYFGSCIIVCLRKMMERLIPSFKKRRMWPENPIYCHYHVNESDRYRHWYHFHRFLELFHWIAFCIINWVPFRSLKLDRHVQLLNFRNISQWRWSPWSTISVDLISMMMIWQTIRKTKMKSILWLSILTKRRTRLQRKNQNQKTRFIIVQFVSRMYFIKYGEFHIIWVMS